MTKLADFTAEAWNSLPGTENPFLRHEFLSALEETGCVSPETGWLPQHLAVIEEHDDRTQLLGAALLYLKNHSFGEYIFDWAWANAYSHAGLDYYPKLTSAVPFTPVTGQRLLIANGAERKSIANTLISGAMHLAKEHQASSLHWLFVPNTDIDTFSAHSHLQRVGYQYHWHNHDYKNFADFLAELSSNKRKKIKQERRYVREAGIKIEVVTGDNLTETHWDSFYNFYLSTIHNYGAIPYLNRDFFSTINKTLADQIVLILARQDNQYVAGALNFRSHDALFGRYWGSTGHHRNLHFETCYYRAIEYCIEQGLTRFEAGAQGRHKLSRGFLPSEVYSAHWLSHPQFNDAVAKYLEREKNGIAFEIDDLTERSPFKLNC